MLPVYLLIAALAFSQVVRPAPSLASEDAPPAVVAPTFPDCNNNGWPDEVDIFVGYSEDANFNGIPDECERVPALAGISESRS